MGVAINCIKCKDCEEKSYVVLEWKIKEKAMEEIKNKKCPKCNSDNWYFTDTMGQ